MLAAFVGLPLSAGRSAACLRDGGQRPAPRSSLKNNRSEAVPESFMNRRDPAPLCIQHRLTGLLRYKKGEGAEPHAHPHEQIFLVLSGVVKATLGGEVRELHQGQVMHVPPHLLHGITILEDAEVISAKGIVGGVGHRI